jgi:hypothetical protein
MSAIPPPTFGVVTALDSVEISIRKSIGLPVGRVPIVGVASENADVAVLDTRCLKVRDGCTSFRVAVVET